MERLPLPSYVTAKQQITQLPNGEFARDRLMVVQKTDVIPVMDPAISDFIAKQAGKQIVQDGIDSAMPGVWFILAFCHIVIMPATLIFSLWVTN